MAVKEKKSEKLCFYTTGDSFTGLVRMFWNEGSIRKVSEILEPLPKKIKHKIVIGEMKFEGDSREGDLLVVKDKDGSKDEAFEIVKRRLHETGNRLIDYNKMPEIREYESVKEENLEEAYNEAFAEAQEYCNITGTTIKDFEVSKIKGTRVLSQDELDDLKEQERLDRIVPVDFEKEAGEDIAHGLIMPNGDFYECGPMDHINLEHDLSKKKIILHPTMFHGSYDDEFNNIVKLSGRQLCGRGIWNLVQYEDATDEKFEERCPLTKAQAETIVKLIASAPEPGHIEVYGELPAVRGMQIVEKIMKRFEL